MKTKASNYLTIKLDKEGYSVNPAGHFLSAFTNSFALLNLNPINEDISDCLSDVLLSPTEDQKKYDERIDKLADWGNSRGISTMGASMSPIDVAALATGVISEFAVESVGVGYSFIAASEGRYLEASLWPALKAITNGGAYVWKKVKEKRSKK